MTNDTYLAFLHARNVSEQMLRSHSADKGSFAKTYHFEEAMKALHELVNDLGYVLIKSQPASPVTILPIDADEEMTW